MNKRAKGKSLFPMWLFFVYLVVLLLMSGLHSGLLVAAQQWGWSSFLQTISPILYWSAVAGGLTVFTRYRIRITYEQPMLRMAEATRKVARGDFSVYLAPSHTPDKMDYLDHTFMNFNKMVEELGSIETLKTDFFSDVSHEFKSPLAVISASSELLGRSRSLTVEEQKAVDSIRDAARRLADLIQNMLKLNKLEKQAIRPAPVEFDLCAQLCACAVQFEDSWEKKELDFSADLEDRALVCADPGLTELIWNNLLSNAVKFTPEGGQVLLTQRTRDNWVEVTVQDTGCGMTPETIRHIFDKFYQGDTSHSTQGNGLGLALVKRILELSGGEITVTSQPGEGSAFTVRLPKPDRQEVVP